MADIDDVKQALNYIDPAKLSYQEWLDVGMAIKASGASCSLWDEWSRRDPDRYDRSCWSKWESFNSSGITEKTLFKMAINGGYHPSGDWKYEGTSRELLDSEVIDISEYYKVIDPDNVDVSAVPSPVHWDPIEDIRTYLSVLFAPDDHVSYCTQCYKDKDGKYHPSGRSYDRTAGRLLEELDSATKIEDVFYDYNHDCGAWISFNPMDGSGGKADNITDFRYALVESDKQDLNTQYALMKELQLPIAALVHSGNKSIHAIVRINAGSEKDYSRKVDTLFKICQKNGLDVDTSTKNPSRLSRMPGFMRGGNRQYLIETNIGCGSFDEWIEYIESINDDLPDPVDFSEIYDNLPELAPELIQGVLRKGHKMLISGGSKTGKSMLMIQLAIAIASGGHWLNFLCMQGKVLYVNLEIDPASFARRVYEACEKRSIRPEEIQGNLKVWNLRGHSSRLDKLAPKLIRRCSRDNYMAIIIDPIYKVMMGDENKAGDMAQFCNQFDAIASALNCAVIYVHHFAKGDAGKKASIDRASGSGVFARDPDTIATITKLKTSGEAHPAARIEFTMREFADIDPIDVFYMYPIHVVDQHGELKEAKMEGESTQKSHEDNLVDFVNSLHVAFESLAETDESGVLSVPQQAIADYLGMDRSYFSRRLKEAVKNDMTDLRKQPQDKKIGASAKIYRPE